VTNITGASQTVDIQDGNGGSYLSGYVIPANSTMQVITGSSKGFWWAGGIQVRAGANNAVNVQIAGYQ
jgi:hypothetical protein